MKKKYDTLEIINIVDKAFINFEEMFKSKKSEKKIDDDSQFNGMLTTMKLAVMAEIMGILKEEE